jgi:hypothetical protein
MSTTVPMHRAKVVKVSTEGSVWSSSDAATGKIAGAFLTGKTWNIPAVTVMLEMEIETQ